MKFWIGLFLFMLLGLALGAMGIGAADNPVSFFTILGIAILIDLNASINK